jgi:hypothetical protein
LKCHKSKKRKRTEKQVCRAGLERKRQLVLVTHQVLYFDLNHKCVVQSSLDLCQSWRGKCDFQILLYESDPFSPDPSEIAWVTDYVVAYACKGNSTLTEEKRQIKQLVLR